MIGGRLYLDFGFSNPNYYMMQHGIFLEVDDWHEKSKFFLRPWAKGLIAAVVILVVMSICGIYRLIVFLKKRRLRKELKSD